MSETWYPEAVRLHITTQEYTVGRSGYAITSEVKHITAGSDSRGWLQNADNGSSVHFLIRIEDVKAVVYQFMPIEWAAWGNGRFSRNNPYAPPWVRDFINSQPDTPAGRDKVSRFLLGHTISTEHEGVTPTAQLFTGPMLEASIALTKWLHETVPTLIVDREHIIGHYQIDNVNRAFCPGGPGGLLFPFGAIIAAVNAAPDPIHIDELFFAETGKTVHGEIYKYFFDHGAVIEFGYPLTEEYQLVLEDTREWTVQLFEKSMITYRPDSGVLRANIGAMYGKLAGVL